MKTIKYIRVSTAGQNTDSQTRVDSEMMIDVCSGSTLFKSREKGKILLAMASAGKLQSLEVHAIDRLGRNTIDILETIQTFTDLGVNVVSEKEGLNTLLPNGSVNPVSKMIISILATLAEFELNRIKERQREGIAAAKKRGAYAGNGGHKKVESIEKFITKKKNAKCYKLLLKGFSLRHSAKVAEVSLGTAQKISGYINNGLLDGANDFDAQMERAHEIKKTIDTARIKTK